MSRNSKPSILKKEDNQQHVNEVQHGHKPTRDGIRIEYLECSGPSSKALAVSTDRQVIPTQPHELERPRLCGPARVHLSLEYPG